VRAPGFQTARLRMRALSEGDQALFCRLYTDAESMRFIGRPLSMTRALAAFHWTLQSIREESTGPCFFAIVAKASKRAVGLCAIQPVVRTAQRAEIGIMLAPEVRGKRVLLARASRGREILAEMLAAAGATVDQVVVYESRDIASPDLSIAEILADGKVDYITVTSSAIARSLVNLFGDALHKTRLAAISPLTASVLAEHGVPPAIVAETYTTDGLVSAILAAEAGKP